MQSYAIISLYNMKHLNRGSYTELVALSFISYYFLVYYNVEGTYVEFVPR